MRRALAILAVLALGGGAGLWLLSAPAAAPLPDAATAAGDAEAGRLVFAAAGCESCHVAPDAGSGDGPPVLAGGQRFETGFGVFVAPNISMHQEAGIGAWTDAEIARAVIQGISPDGRHYYPAFPFRAYALATPDDIADLVAYLRTLPADPTPSAAHELNFPFSLRRGLGLWNLAAGAPGFVVAEDGLSEPALRGRYLAEALGHCGECHTPRDALGRLRTDAWFTGAPNPSGRGRIPAIHPGALSWSEADIAAYLESGLTPDFDVAGGSMAAVVRGLAKLPKEDLAALAAYLKAVPGGGP